MGWAWATHLIQEAHLQFVSEVVGEGPWIAGKTASRVVTVARPAKVPYVDKSRQWLQDGKVIRQDGQGLGDIIIGTPIKKYVNKKGYTYNLGLTPNLRLPTGSTGDDWAVGNGSWDAGLSLNYSFETPKWYHLYDLYYWKNGSGRNFDQGDEVAFDANIGWHAWQGAVRRATSRGDETSARPSKGQGGQRF